MDPLNRSTINNPISSPKTKMGQNISKTDQESLVTTLTESTYKRLKNQYNKQVSSKDDCEMFIMVLKHQWPKYQG